MQLFVLGGVLLLSIVLAVLLAGAVLFGLIHVLTSSEHLHHSGTNRLSDPLIGNVAA